VSEIEQLGSADLDACFDLAADRGWNPDRRRWALILRVGEAYGIRDPAGGLAGCVVLTRYGAGLVAVGMMLVATRHERRGLGRRLMEHVLARAGDATVFLYATRFGRPLYERLGFRVVSDVTTCEGAFSGAATGATRPATAADRPAIGALDAAAFGAGRDALLDAHLALAERVHVLEDGGGLRGFGAAVARSGSLLLGPLVAPDLAAARALVADLAAGRDGTVRIDVDARHAELRDWAAGHGIEPRETVWLMVHGDRALPGDRDRLVLPAMLATG
jgi:GNAT superfamily N-acetyltransferase